MNIEDIPDKLEKRRELSLEEQFEIRTRTNPPDATTEIVKCLKCGLELLYDYANSNYEFYNQRPQECCRYPVCVECGGPITILRSTNETV